MKNELPRLCWDRTPADVPPCNPTPLERWGDGTGALVYGDCLGVLGWIPDFMGRPHLVYMDPPFASGKAYTRGEAAAYDDRWNDLGSFLDFLESRIEKIIDTLSENGSLFVHLDWHAVHYVKVLLDSMMGYRSFVNELVWHYYNKYSRGRGALPRAHDTILWYARGSSHTFNEVRAERLKPVRQLRRVMVDGRLINARDEEGRLQYREVNDFKVDDVWTIPQLQPASKAWTGYPTQKHPALLEMIVLMASSEGDLVFDPFCGSGTTLVAAHTHGRRFVGIDASPVAVAVSRARLASTGAGFILHGCTPLPESQRSVGVRRSRDGTRVSLDSVDDVLGWAVGRVEEGVFVAGAHSFRQNRRAPVSEMALSPEDEVVRVYFDDGTVFDSGLF